MTTRLLPVTALSVIALSVGVAAASDVPFYAAGGVAMFSGDLRQLTDLRGYTAGIGWGDKVKSLVGAPSLDLNWGHVAGNGNKFDSVSVMYSERVPLAESLYLGAGVGSFWNHLTIQGEAQNKWSIGVRGSAGISLGAFNSFAPFIEATWFYPLQKTNGIKTDYIALVAGFWF